MKQILGIFTMFTLGLAVASAQDTTANKNDKMGGSTTVTGCLAQGSGDAEYTIRDSGGKTYNLKGTKVNLKPHVGHQVSITGMSSDSSMDHSGASGRDRSSSTSDTRSSSSSGNASGQMGNTLQVTDLKMVSTSCQQ